MNVGDAIDDAYLAVSVIALVMHGVSLRTLRARRVARPMIRTMAYRLACAVLYVAVGVEVLVWDWSPKHVALGVFTVTQGVWILNSWFDRRVAKGKHRRRWPITITIGRPPTTDTRSETP